MIAQLPPDIRDAIANYFAECEDEPVSLKDFTPSSGGCINHGGRLETSVGNFFLKWNLLADFPGMLDAESRGLALLRRSNSVNVPPVIYSSSTDDHQFLLLGYIGPAPRAPDYWMKLGEDLAALHRNRAPLFGLDHDNYIGSLPQRNSQNSSWIDFFVTHRLEAQLSLASGKIDLSVRRQFDRLISRLDSLLVLEPPSLLHGDLWSGNVMTNEAGNPSFIDPAVYYGNREVDLAMTQLFGGFDSDFLEGYHASFPLAKGFRERFDIYNLYPLLVHVNLFGGAYLSQVKQTLNQLA